MVWDTTITARLWPESGVYVVTNHFTRLLGKECERLSQDPDIADGNHRLPKLYEDDLEADSSLLYILLQAAINVSKEAGGIVLRLECSECDLSCATRYWFQYGKHIKTQKSHRELVWEEVIYEEG